ncbi:MAG: CDP-diacylglycerol--glycerol-3-phosphate 3-phosphatidyltransferase [bacterium]|nr:MAG: CDP-diacylglycerol--glycerol-3-phosphate 3-phosphatidyltransferase [bacterium]
MNLPTQLTVLRIVLTPVFLVLIFYNGFKFKIFAFVVYIIASLTDWYDGYYARKLGTVSKWGKFLDPLADKILVSSALVAFHFLGYIRLWFVIVIVVRDFLITGLRSYALFKNQPVTTICLAKVKTFTQMASVYVIFLILIFKQLASVKGTDFVVISFLEKINFIDKLMILVVLLTVYTGIHYFVENRSHIKSILIAFYRAFVPSDL